MEKINPTQEYLKTFKFSEESQKHDIIPFTSIFYNEEICELLSPKKNIIINNNLYFKKKTSKDIDKFLPCKTTLYGNNGYDFIEFIEKQYDFFCSELLKILEEDPDFIFENSSVKYFAKLRVEYYSQEEDLFIFGRCSEDKNVFLDNYTREYFLENNRKFLTNIITFDLIVFQKFVINYFRNKIKGSNLLNFNINSLKNLDRDGIKDILQGFNFSEEYFKHSNAVDFYIYHKGVENFDIDKFYENKEMVFILINDLFDNEVKVKYLKNEHNESDIAVNTLLKKHIKEQEKNIKENDLEEFCGISIPDIVPYDIKFKFNNLFNFKEFYQKDFLTKEDLEEILLNINHYHGDLVSFLGEGSFMNKFIEKQQDLIEDFLLDNIETDKLFFFKKECCNNEYALKFFGINQSYILENPILKNLCFYYIRKNSSEFFSYNLANALYDNGEVSEDTSVLLDKIKAKTKYAVQKDKNMPYFSYQELQKKFDYFSYEDLKMHKNIFENIFNLNKNDFLEIYNLSREYNGSIEYYICNYIYNLRYDLLKINGTLSIGKGEFSNNLYELFENFLLENENRSIGFLNSNGDIYDNNLKSIDPFLFLRVLKYFKKKDKFIELFKNFFGLPKNFSHY